LPGGNSEWEPPESIPNSEVKTFCADDSVGSPHVKVGHCQAFIREAPSVADGAFFLFFDLKILSAMSMLVPVDEMH
jgi:hypothetical protein